MGFIAPQGFIGVFDALNRIGNAKFGQDWCVCPNQGSARTRLAKTLVPKSESVRTVTISSSSPQGREVSESIAGFETLPPADGPENELQFIEVATALMQACADQDVSTKGFGEPSFSGFKPKQAFWLADDSGGKLCRRGFVKAYGLNPDGSEDLTLHVFFRRADVADLAQRISRVGADQGQEKAAALNAQEDCEKWIRSFDKAQRQRKEDVQQEAFGRIAGLTTAAFNRAWKEAAPQEWKSGGRIPSPTSSPNKGT